MNILSGWELKGPEFVSLYYMEPTTSGVVTPPWASLSACRYRETCSLTRWARHAAEATNNLPFTQPLTSLRLSSAATCHGSRAGVGLGFEVLTALFGGGGM